MPFEEYNPMMDKDERDLQAGRILWSEVMKSVSERLLHAEKEFYDDIPNNWFGRELSDEEKEKIKEQRAEQYNRAKRDFDALMVLIRDDEKIRRIDRTTITNITTWLTL